MKNTIEEKTVSKADQPYTLSQLFANLETMKDVTDLAWCRQVSSSICERGVAAVPVEWVNGQNGKIKALQETNADLLAALEGVLRIADRFPLLSEFRMSNILLDLKKLKASVEAAISLIENGQSKELSQREQHDWEQIHGEGAFAIGDYLIYPKGHWPIPENTFQ